MEKPKQAGVSKAPYFERNNYFYAKLMTVRDFCAEQRYFNEKRWLINRMVNGWGVVCGLEVKRDCNDHTKVVVTPGMAVDRSGREILVCEHQTVSLKLEEPGCPEKIKPETKLWVCIEYQECPAEPLPLAGACEQQAKSEFNRIRDSFRIFVIRADKPIQDNDREDCPQGTDKTKPLHTKLCEQISQECIPYPEHSHLVLAEVTITVAQEQGCVMVCIDQCSKRNLVYGNQLLYDLIRCYHEDLPHVVSINWTHGGTINECCGEESPLKCGIKVGFDREMNSQTLNEHTFLFLTKIRNEETGYFLYKQVPGDYCYDCATNTATFFIKAELCVPKGGEYMVVLKGDFIMSGEDSPKALDGNFINGLLPSGNGTQGEDFVSWFSVSSPLVSAD